MRVGAHVRAGGQLIGALDRGDAIGAEVIQIFTQSPRGWKPTQYASEVLAAYRAAQEAHPRMTGTYCHASYLINLATSDRELLARSRACLTANLTVARGIGASGLVLHVGSHKGSGLQTCLPQVVDALCEASDLARPPAGTAGYGGCPVLLENAAGAGGTVGRSFDELAEILRAMPHPEVLGVCLDTQHLWASGISFATLEEADGVLSEFDRVIGLDRLRCLHVNDSKVPFGANRDRHANIGEGTIGADALAALLGHPSLGHLPAILEVPGAGSGIRAQDIEAVRHLQVLGARQRAQGPSGAAGAAGPGPAAAGTTGPGSGRLRSASGASHAGRPEKETT